MNKQEIENIKQKALEEHIPIIMDDTLDVIAKYLKEIEPKRILEIGTAVGYSAICFSEFLEHNGRIDTIERDNERVNEAKENIKKAGRENVIKLLEGDAMEIMPTLERDQFDFVFMDAAKAQYIHFLPEVLRLMKKDGVLITDNVLQEGDLIQSKYVVRRRDRTIHKRMREYLEVVKNHPQLETSIVPIGDGITMSVKK